MNWPGILLAGFAGWLNLAFFQSTTIGGQSTTNLSVIAGTVIGGMPASCRSTASYCGSPWARLSRHR